jgi:Domain of unknown function (DUF3332)
VSWRQTLAALVLVGLGGCFGQFAVTSEVVKRNSELETAPAREVIFLALLIVPVYEVSLLADVLVFNTIELVTGTNPVHEHDEPAEPGEVPPE